MKQILFFFVDGVGLGPVGPSNPLSTFDGPTLRRLGAGQRWCRPFQAHQSPHHLVRPIDATLGVEGLPQSGTGQASLLTGVNCADVVGRHFGPFPHSKTHSVLDEHNLFQQLKQRTHPERPPAFANAFPPQYFDASRRRTTVTTHCCEAANVPLRTMDALQNQHAVPADLTGAAWRDQLQLPVPERSAAQAADVLASITACHSLTLFEYFLTDKAGHNRIETDPSVLLAHLDQAWAALLATFDPSETTLLITSDHGNLEDASHTRHTRHPVPLIVHGWAAPFFDDATDLTDVTPALLAALASTGT